MSAIKISADRLVNLHIENAAHGLRVELEFPPKPPGKEPRRLPVHTDHSLVWPGVKLVIEELP